MEERLAKYVQYIQNTKKVPLAVSIFDEDWEPIGPMVRRDLVEAGLIDIYLESITLVS